MCIRDSTSNLADGMFVDITIEDTNISEENYFHVNFYHIAKVDLDNDGIPDPFMAKPMVMSKFSPGDPGILFVEDRGVLLTDRSFPGEPKTFVYKLKFEPGVIDYLQDQTSFGRIIAELRTVDSNYYNFWTTAASRFDDDDSSLSTNDTNDISNIENGLGYFSGYSTRRDTFIINQ